MSTRITFVDDELAHYGVKGMRWGVRRMRANMAGKKAARSHIKGTNALLSVTRDSATKKTKKLNAKWRGTEHEAAFEKAKQKELRKQIKWHGKGYEAARGAKNVALGNYRNVGVGILATAALFKGGQALGVIPANSVIKDRAHAAGQSVYNKVRKTSIDGIRSAARMAAERQRNKEFYDQFRAAGIKI